MIERPIRARMTTRGRVTLPKQVREELGVVPGHEVDFIWEDGRLLIVKLLQKSAETDLRR
jgi:AbrB family looped-hinge helix DNA binding protein